MQDGVIVIHGTPLFIKKNAKLQITTISQKHAGLDDFSSERKGKHSIFASLDVPFMPVFPVRWNTKVTPSTLDSAFSSAVYTHFEKGLSLLCFSGKVACHTRVDDDSNDSRKPWLPFLWQSFVFPWMKDTFCFGYGSFFAFVCHLGKTRWASLFSHAKVVRIHSMVIIYTGS